uniref:Uncharacterized protein n=1 Tax=Moniliophthora roreri TaxID=221103 RepID=A0A0W0FA02_MONRR
MTASPPLRVVDFVGQAIGFVPFHWAVIVGTIVRTVSQSGMHVVSKTPTDRYLRAANLQLFKPRGLSVRICTALAMEKLLSPNEVNQNRILGHVISAIAGKPPTITPSEGPVKDSALNRRLARTQAYALPPDVDNMPPPRESEGVIDAIASLGVKFDASRREHEERQNAADRRALAAERKGIDPGMFSDYQSTAHTNPLHGLEQLIFKLMGDRMTELERRVANADLLEHWAGERTLWVVVMSSGNDSKIEGIKVAEDLADEERIDDQTWKNKMQMERKQFEKGLRGAAPKEHIKGKSPALAPEESGSAPQGYSSGVELTRDADLLIRSFLPERSGPEPPPYAQLPQAVCLPQVSLHAKWDSAFARGYNHALGDAGISQEDFLSFIDGLNLAIAASPPLRVVDFAGKIIGFVPYHWAMIAGIVIQTTAQTTMHVLSKTLTDRYLRAANLRLFKPRGLSVRICTTLAMQRLLSPNEDRNGPSKLDQFGRLVGSTVMRLPIPVVGPILRRVVRAIADKPPTISPSEGLAKNSVVKRRLARTQAYALPLDVDNVPPPQKPEGVMDTIASWGVRFDEYMQGKEVSKNEDRRRALAAERMGIDLRLLSAREDTVNPHRAEREFDRQARAHSRALRRQRRGRGPGLLSLVLGPKMTKMESRVATADLLEYWADEKLLWVVIMPSENDSSIEGIELAEDPVDEERIDDRAWKSEMQREKEQVEDELDDLEELQELQYHEASQAGSSKPGK